MVSGTIRVINPLSETLPRIDANGMKFKAEGILTA
jgi:hypothetical protein